MIVRSAKVALVCFILSVSMMPSLALADGPRLRLFQKRSVESAQRAPTQNDRQSRVVRDSGARATVQPSSGGSVGRLPSGRNYYQGQYYGNFNNRFYGPQYGYF